MYYCPMSFAGFSGLFTIMIVIRYWYIFLPCTIAFIIGLLLFFRWIGGETESERCRRIMRQKRRELRRERREERRFNRKHGLKDNYRY